jgi:hypothetical protein
MSLHSINDEKKDIISDQHTESGVRELSADERYLAFTPKQRRDIVRRVDFRLVVTLGCLYCISLLDRTNLGAASVAGYVSYVAFISTQI